MQKKINSSIFINSNNKNNKHNQQLVTHLLNNRKSNLLYNSNNKKIKIFKSASKKNSLKTINNLNFKNYKSTCNNKYCLIFNQNK